MARLDRIKEELGWLKVMLGIVVAVHVSLVAWVAQNYASVSLLLLVSAMLCIGALTGAGIWINRQAMKRFEELEEL